MSATDIAKSVDVDLPDMIQEQAASVAENRSKLQK